jgi:hypothetical protein
MMTALVKEVKHDDKAMCSSFSLTKMTMIMVTVEGSADYDDGSQTR